ncbi:MAG TPA: 3-methyladenine DNA glycosylase [Actinotalea sp.]|nr:3-methyladenine DNA glycosylase [Actinotalea sp.]
MTGRATTTLSRARWARAQDEHAARADALTAAHRARRAAGLRHPVEDFLADYYGLRPGPLRRWHPGVGVTLEGSQAPHAAWRWYRTETVRAHGRPAHVVGLDVEAFLADRGRTAAQVRALLVATASRPAFTGCLGLHEWAMVYRQDDADRRHDLPLRLGRAGTDAVVEAHPLRCSHIDAVRFFTPQAVPLNRLHPTRETQVDLEQPGCLHANMDLTRAALKLGPAVPGDLLLDCVELAREIRLLDMQASPYDLSTLGERAVAIETPEGRAEYVARQRAFAERAEPLRRRLIGVCDDLLGTDGPQPG